MAHFPELCFELELTDDVGCDLVRVVCRHDEFSMSREISLCTFFAEAHAHILRNL